MHALLDLDQDEEDQRCMLSIIGEPHQKKFDQTLRLTTLEL